jgi:hypothetical protein
MTNQITTEKLISEMAFEIRCLYETSLEAGTKAALRRLNELGFAIVPREVTNEMAEAAFNAGLEGGSDFWNEYAAAISAGEIK